MQDIRSVHQAKIPLNAELEELVTFSRGNETCLWSKNERKWLKRIDRFGGKVATISGKIIFVTFLLILIVLCDLTEYGQ